MLVLVDAAGGTSSTSSMHIRVLYTITIKFRFHFMLYYNTEYMKKGTQIPSVSSVIFLSSVTSELSESTASDGLEP